MLGQYATGYTKVSGLQRHRRVQTHTNSDLPAAVCSVPTDHKGLQNGPNPHVPMAVATLKHWLANNVEGGVGKYSRMNMDANVSAYDLASSYMVAFESAIRDGGALGIMW